MPRLGLLRSDAAFFTMEVGALASFHDFESAWDGFDGWKLPVFSLNQASHPGPAAFRAT